MRHVQVEERGVLDEAALGVHEAVRDHLVGAVARRAGAHARAVVHALLGFKIWDAKFGFKRWVQRSIKEA